MCSVFPTIARFGARRDHVVSRRTMTAAACLTRAVKAADDARHLRERLAACYEELVETRANVPVNLHQVSFKAAPAPVANDPLVGSSRRSRRHGPTDDEELRR